MKILSNAMAASAAAGAITAVSNMLAKQTENTAKFGKAIQEHMQEQIKQAKSLSERNVGILTNSSSTISNIALKQLTGK